VNFTRGVEWMPPSLFTYRRMCFPPALTRANDIDKVYRKTGCLMPAKRISNLLKSHSLGLAGANAQSAGPVAPHDPIAVDSVLKPYFLAGRGTRRVDANFDSRSCE